jgi:hypothetical protein
VGGPRARQTKPHLRFEIRPKLPNRVTRIWAVNSGLATLGDVRWYSYWRRFVFEPKTRWHQVVFDASCLREIADFCEEQTLKHRVARKRLKEKKDGRRTRD